MLTITPTAVDAIRQLVENADVADSGGIRIAAGEPTTEGTPLQLALVERPEPGDEVAGPLEATVYLEPQIAAVLDGTVLDAVINDDQVEFALRDEQIPSPSPNGNGAL